MQTKKEAVLREYKKAKFTTKHPRTINSFVVAFTSQEPFDVIPTKENFGKSLKFIKPIAPSGHTDSTRNFSITPVERFSYTLDTYAFSDEKIDISDDNQCGDVERNSLQICDHLGVGIKKVHDITKIVYSASKNMQRCIVDNSLTTKAKVRRLAKSEKVSFKYGHYHNNLPNKQKKYNEKVKRNSLNLNKISKGIARSRILKNVLAKEDFLAARGLYCNAKKFDVNNEWSWNFSPSLPDETHINCASLNNLVPREFSTFISGNSYEISAMNSVIKVPYTRVHKTNIHGNNDVASNILKPNINQSIGMPSNDQCVNEETFSNSKITSILEPGATSQASTNYKIRNNLNTDAVTNIGKKCLVRPSSYDDIFEVASSISETIMCSNFRTDNLMNYEKVGTHNIPNRNILYEVINLDTVSYSASSNENSYSGDDCSGEVTKNMSPSNSSVTWDRLTFVLDLAVNRLQYTLDKEILELKKLLAIFVPKNDKQHVNKTQDEQLKVHEKQNVQQDMFGAKKQSVIKTELCLKEGSLQNKVEDLITLKLNVDKCARLPSVSIFLKELETLRIVNNYIEAPVIDKEVGKGDTLTTTFSPLVSDKTCGFQRVNQINQEPMSIADENRVAAICHELNKRFVAGPIFRNESSKYIKGVNKLVLYTAPIDIIPRNKTANNCSLNDNISMNKPQATNVLKTLSTTPIQIVSILDIVDMHMTNKKQCRDANERYIQKHNYLEDDAKHLDGHHKISNNNIISFNNLKRYKHYFNNLIIRAKKLERIDFRFQNRNFTKKTLKKVYGTVKMTSNQNQKVSQIASTPCILEKVLPKEHLLNDPLSSSSSINLLKNKNWSLHSSPFLIAYKTPLNNSRRSTLIPRNFSTSITDDVNSISVKNCKLQECKTNTHNNLVAVYDCLKQNIKENLDDSRTVSSRSAEPTLQPPGKTSVGVDSSYDDIILIAQELAENKASNSSVPHDSSNNTGVPNGNTSLETVIVLDNVIFTSNARANTECNAGKTEEDLPIECLKDNLNNDTPSDVNKMWTRLTLILGSALKRLKNIFKMEMRDIKTQVEIHPQPNVSVSDIVEMLRENVVQVNPKSKAILGLQNNCTDTKVQFADQTMLTMDVAEPVELHNSSFKTHRIGKDYIGISRPHTIEDVEEGKGDTVASVILVATDEPHRFERMKFWVRTVLLLARENVVAIAVSVPCFFIIFSWLSEMFVLIKSIENGIKHIRGSNQVD